MIVELRVGFPFESIRHDRRGFGDSTESPSIPGRLIYSEPALEERQEVRGKPRIGEFVYDHRSHGGNDLLTIVLVVQIAIRYLRELHGLGYSHLVA